MIKLTLAVTLAMVVSATAFAQREKSEETVKPEAPKTREATEGILKNESSEGLKAKVEAAKAQTKNDKNLKAEAKMDPEVQNVVMEMRKNIGNQMKAEHIESAKEIVNINRATGNRILNLKDPVDLAYAARLAEHPANAHEVMSEIHDNYGFAQKSAAHADIFRRLAGVAVLVTISEEGGENYFKKGAFREFLGKAGDPADAHYDDGALEALVGIYTKAAALAKRFHQSVDSKLMIQAEEAYGIPHEEAVNLEQMKCLRGGFNQQG